MMSLSMKKCSIFLKNNKNNTFGSQIKRNFMVTRPSHNLGLQFKFHKASSRNFGSISILSRGFLVSKLSKIIGTRAGIYRLLLVACLVHVIATISGSLLIDRQIMMSITDYVNNLTIKEDQTFQIFGILKPGSVELKRGTLQTRFCITDFTNEIDVLYTGAFKFEFKEGETIVLTCYLPDKNKKNLLYCIDYMVKHSMELNNWQDKNNIRRDIKLN